MDLSLHRAGQCNLLRRVLALHKEALGAYLDLAKSQDRSTSSSHLVEFARLIRSVNRLVEAVTDKQAGPPPRSGDPEWFVCRSFAVIRRVLEIGKTQARLSNAARAKLREEHFNLEGLPNELLRHIFVLTRDSSPNNLPDTIYKNVHVVKPLPFNVGPIEWWWEQVHLAFDDLDTLFTRTGCFENIKVIKSLRLTCSRFCSLSSELLIPVVNVFMTESSLARLDNISRHPEIASGVRFVQVHSASLDAHVAQIPTTFTRLCIGIIEAKLHEYAHHRRALEDEVATNYQALLRVRTMQKAILLCNGLREAWIPLCSDFSVADDAVSHYDADMRSALRRSHAEYRARWLEHESVSKNFVNAVAEAMGRMKKADRLCLSDMTTRFGFNWQFILNKGLAPFVTLSEPQDICDSVTAQVALATPFEGLRKRSWYLLQQLPIAISKSGRTLKALHVDILPPLNRNYELFVNSDHLNMLRQSCEHLTTMDLRFADADCIHTYPMPSGTKALWSLLSALIVSPKIRHLAIDLKFPQTIKNQDPFPEYEYCMGPTLLSRSWDHLVTVDLRGISIRKYHLEKFVDGLVPSVRTHLSNIELLEKDGWVKILDKLRTKADNQSQMWEIHGGEVPSLGEFFFAPISMPHANQHARRLLLSDYISGRTDINPIAAILKRIEEEEEASDDTDEAETDSDDETISDISIE